MPVAAEPPISGHASGTGPIPPDPEAYDSPRAVQARARGLAAPYIPGGEDPELPATQRRERRYRRLLIAMVLVVVLAGFVLGIVANLLGMSGLLGGEDAGATPGAVALAAFTANATAPGSHL
jgi:hypothetical protein